MSTVHLRLPEDLSIGSGAVGELCRRVGSADRALVVATARFPVDSALLGHPSGLEVLPWSGEPNVDTVQELADGLAESDPTVVVGIGGGSVLDTAKELAAAIPNRKRPLIDHLEVVGLGLTLEADPLPVVAVPTTAGTGSEMTSNAVLDVPSAGRKVSLRDHRLTPRSVIVDPDLGRDVPPSVAAACALDAAVQLVESFATPLANPISDLWARGGAQRGLTAAGRVVDGTANEDDRSAMAIAAMCSGAALATAKLGTIHGFAGVVGGATGMGHGQLCGLFAAPVLRATIEELEQEQPDHPSLARYRELARLTDPEASTALDLARWFDQLTGRPPFEPAVIAALGTDERRQIVAATEAASSTVGNPVQLSTETLRDILDCVASG